MRKIIAIIAVLILLLTFAIPATATEVWEYSTSEELVRIQYEDGSYGNIPINTTDYVFDDWAEYYSVDDSGTEIYNESINKGVQFGAFFENEANVVPTEGDSVAQNYTMYEQSVFPPDGFSHIEVTAIPLTQHYVEINSNKIMNGAQEIWYRSPIKWSSDYEVYRINIYNTESDELVYVGETGRAYGNIQARDIGFVEDDRIYIKLNFKFYSDVKYRIVEGVETVDDNPISSVDIYFANNQDIGDDGEMNSYVFPGTSLSRKFEDLELSWSMCATVGIGQAGTEKMIELSKLTAAPSRRVEIVSQYIYGSVDDVDYINITVPFRFSKATNITVVVMTYGDNSDTGSAEVTVDMEFYNVTGTLKATIPIDDSDAGETNAYRIAFRFYDVDDEDHWMSYFMIPSSNSFHKVFAAGSGYKLIAIPHFDMFIELEEGEVVEPFLDAAIRLDTVLLGVGFFIAGILASSVAITHGNIPLLLVGVGLIAGGAYTIQQGLQGISPGSSTVGTVINQIASGTVKLGKIVWEGVSWVAENLWDGVLWVVEKLQIIGAGLLNIAEVIFDFLFFILFMVVVWFWAKFLKIMDGIVSGDMDKALATTRQTIGTPIKVARRYLPGRRRR
jgi:hypothetical protein